MTIRFNSGDPNGVPSGYAGANIPDDLVVPSCGLEDVDSSLFQTFDKEINFVVSSGQSKESKKVPVIFAAGERWAMIKRGKAIRDTNGTLILPLITIRRTSVEQDISLDVNGRGINQQTGEIVINRRLSKKDRAYQNLVNKLGIDNDSTLLTTRPTKENQYDIDVLDGGLMAPKYSDNVWEVITIPSPQFFTAVYEVTLWTQYAVHMNQLLEKLLASYLPQGQALLLNTPKGYWFVANVENGFTPEDNADDMSSEERLLRYKFTVKVPAYIVAPQIPGTPSPVRKFISAPLVSFTLGGNENEELVNGFPVRKNDPYKDADDPTVGFSLDGSVNSRQNATTQKSINTVRITKSPFTGKERTEYVRVITRNKNGEEVLKEIDGFALKIV